MTRIIIDGRKMKDKETVHPYLKSVLNIDGYYGNNLDALWDVLSTTNQYLEIEFTHHEVMLENLGNYGDAIINVFEEAAEENAYISICK